MSSTVETSGINDGHRSRKRLAEVVRRAKLHELVDLVGWAEPWDVEVDDRIAHEVSAKGRRKS